MCAEIVAYQQTTFSLFNSHALIKATAQDYIRIAQTKLILQPLIDHLLLHLRTKQAIEIQLTEILQDIQTG